MTRLLRLSGVAFVALVLLAIVVLSGDHPESDAAGSELLSFYDDHAVRQGLAAFVLAASVPFLVLFALSLATADSPTEARRLSFWEILLVAGSAVSGAVFLLMAAIHFALVDAAEQELSEGALEALSAIDGNTWVAFNPALGLMMLGAAGSLLGSVRGQRWLGWVALVLGIALFIPYADFVALLLTLIWLVVTSVMLYVGRLRPNEPALQTA